MWLIAIAVVSAAAPRVAARPEQSNVELRVAFAPAPVMVEGAELVVYELAIQNTASEPLSLTRLDVLAGSAGPMIHSLTSDDLVGRLAPIGTSAATPAGVVPAGSRGVIYLEVRLPTAATVSDLHHRLEYVPGTQTTVRTVDGAPVRVNRVAAVVLSAPLRGGPWAAVHSPAWERGHRRVFYAVDGRERIPGRFAIDWIKLDGEGRSGRGDADLVTSALGYGEDVLAVADAAVAATRDDVDEVARISARRKHAPDDASGNYVALDVGAGRYVFYEHLKPGSIRVKPGQRVRRGEVVAALGFTGDSTGPHLHLHVADALSTLGAEGLPFVLDRFDVLGVYRDIADLGKRRWINSGSTPERRERERPAPNIVVDFGRGR